MSECELLETIRQLDAESQAQVRDFVRLLADRRMMTTQTIQTRLADYVRENPSATRDYAHIDAHLGLPSGTAQAYLAESEANSCY